MRIPIITPLGRILSIRRHIRAYRLTKLMLKDMRETYGDINYHAYLDYINSKQFKRAKRLHDLGI